MKNTLITLLLLFTISACQQNISTPTKTQENNGIQASIACTNELKNCPNGRKKSRNPDNNCEFDPCENPKRKNKEPQMCIADVKECRDGSFVGRDHYNKCRFKACPPTKNGRDF